MNLVKRNYQITPSFFDQLIYNELGRQKDSMEKQLATNISESDTLAQTTLAENMTVPLPILSNMIPLARPKLQKKLYPWPD